MSMSEADDYDDIQSLQDAGSFANLYPALIQCFAIITCGYIAGRLQLVTPKETAGLNVFVGTFSLPSLIFLSLAKLNLMSVNWYFLLGIFLSKALVFFAVILITIFITKPSSLARAGIYAIFTTQSNDFAIGSPIVEALYKNSHPEFVSYLYLVAPTSLIMLNPIGFILIGISKITESPSENVQSLPRMVWSVIKGIISNPVVFMSSLGIFGNFLFQHEPPVALEAVLSVFGKAFSATALFLLGLRMVGKVQKLQGAALLTPVLLIAVKLIAMPIVTREVVSVSVHYGDNNASLAPALSTFGFLYGTIPSAPAVFVYATQYGLDTDIIAAAMVLCTFISAPLMFASAKMIAASEQRKRDNFLNALTSFEFDTSIVGFIACVWVLIVFLVSKDFKKLPYRVAAFLIIAEMIGCIGVIFGHIFPGEQMLRFFLTTVGNFSSHLLTAALSATILCIQAQKFTALLKGEIIVLGICLGFPVIATSILMFMITPTPVDTEYDSNFMYGSTEAILCLLVLLTTFLGSICLLTLGQRLRIRNAHFLALVSEANGNNPNNVRVNRVESNFPAPVNSNESSLTESLLESPSVPREARDKLMPHIIFVILLACSIFAKLGLILWRLFSDEMTPVYVEIAFLAIALSRGQGIIAFFLFGIDSAAVFKPVFRRFLTFWYGGGSYDLPPLDSLTLETRTACDQFCSQHLEQCKKDIARDLRCGIFMVRDAFCGSAFLDWLIENSVVSERDEASHLATQLVHGRILRHALYDRRFTDDSNVILQRLVPISATRALPFGSCQITSRK